MVEGRRSRWRHSRRCRRLQHPPPPVGEYARRVELASVWSPMWTAVPAGGGVPAPPGRTRVRDGLLILAGFAPPPFPPAGGGGWARRRGAPPPPPVLSHRGRCRWPVPRSRRIRRFCGEYAARGVPAAPTPRTPRPPPISSPPLDKRRTTCISCTNGQTQRIVDPRTGDRQAAQVTSENASGGQEAHQKSR